MRVALFSDIHGNLTAIEAVLNDLKRHGELDLKICAGDMVFLGSAPSEVLDLLGENGVRMIAGNCDEMVAGRLPLDLPPNPEIAKIHEAHLAWNRARLRPDQMELLKGLDLTLELEPAPGQKLLVCHAAPHSSNVMLPKPGQHTAAELKQAYGPTGARVVAFGHWHQPGVMPVGDMTLVNVSCVSIPQDGQPIAQYTIAEFHGEHWSLRQHRVAYDIAPEIARMQERSMPRPPWPRIG